MKSTMTVPDFLRPPRLGKPIGSTSTTYCTFFFAPKKLSKIRPSPGAFTNHYEEILLSLPALVLVKTSPTATRRPPINRTITTTTSTTNKYEDFFSQY